MTLDGVPAGVRGLLGITVCNWFLKVMSSDAKIKRTVQAGGELHKLVSAMLTSIEN